MSSNSLIFLICVMVFSYFNSDRRFESTKPESSEDLAVKMINGRTVESLDWRSRTDFELHFTDGTSLKSAELKPSIKVNAEGVK